MPKYKLTYYAVMALAEPIRWLLSYGGLEFADIRLSMDEWQSQKSTAPFEALPIFEVDDRVTHQSVAICRYIGTIVGLAGDTPWENFEIDMVVDSTCDFRSKIAVYNKMKDNSPERPPLKETLLNDTIPFYMNRFEKLAGSGYLANRKLSWADIFFVALLDYNNGALDTDIIKPEMYPNLDKLRKHVRAIPAIQSWIASRPESAY